MNTPRNSVSLIGHLGKDVELVETSNGTKCARIRLATNEYYTNSKGEKVQDTQWHTVVSWGKTAELMSKLLKKGSEVAVQGKLVNNSYVDKNGNTVYSTEVRVKEFVKLGKAEKEPLPF